jgi:hypothetical protein
LSIAARLRTEARDLLELVLAPGLAAVLPWALCFRIFGFLSRFDLLYREECNEAIRNAEALGWVREDRARWLRTRRLVTLIDHADFYLARTRSDRWLARHMAVSGDWPDPSQAAVLCTFHWGAGMWGLRHARSKRMRAHAIVAPQVREAFPGRTVKFLYCRARVRSVAAALQTEPIEPSRSPRRIVETLRGGEQIVAAIDVPADQVAASEAISIVGIPARVPRGLLRVAADSRIPVIVFLTGIRMTDGRRTLRIHRVGSRDDAEALMVEVFAFLEQAIESDPAAWHFWSVAPRFFDLGARQSGR